MRTICQPRMTKTHNAEFVWNVQLWYSHDGGATYVYAGHGKYFREPAQAIAYCREHRTPRLHTQRAE